MLHRLAHLLGLARGHVEVWYEGGRLLVGWRCRDCGELRHVVDRTYA